MALLGEQLVGIHIRGTVYKWTERILLPIIMAFRRSSHDPGSMAYVETCDVSKNEVIKAGTRAYVQIDMSSAPKAQPNSMLAGVVEINLGRPTQVPEFKVIGSPEHQFDICKAELSVRTE